MPETDAILQRCRDVIEYDFGDPELLRAALRHSSASDERIDSNERLEFLGDAVLDLVICEELYRRFPRYLEGSLTILKSAVVSRRTCAQVAQELNLERFLILGKGITEQQDVPGSLSAAVLESIVGAIYLDGGLEEARSFILRHFESFIELVDSDQYHRDYKSMLQQYAQSEHGSSPSYELLDEKGPDHAKAFEIAVNIFASQQIRTFPAAWGVSKKDAEQKAAKMALEELSVLEKSPATESLTSTELAAGEAERSQ